MPALLDHCSRAYAAMEAGAEPYDLSGIEIKAWTGFTTKLFADLGISVPGYTHVLRALKEMGCISQVRRGGGGSPSVWAVIHPPTEESFSALGDATRQPSVSPGSQRTKAVEQRTADLNTRVSALETHSEAMQGIIMTWAPIMERLLKEQDGNHG